MRSPPCVIQHLSVPSSRAVALAERRHQAMSLTSTSTAQRCLVTSPSLPSGCPRCCSSPETDAETVLNIIAAHKAASQRMLEMPPSKKLLQQEGRGWNFHQGKESSSFEVVCKAPLWSRCHRCPPPAIHEHADGTTVWCRAPFRSTSVGHFPESERPVQLPCHGELRDEMPAHHHDSQPEPLVFSDANASVPHLTTGRSPTTGGFLINFLNFSEAIEGRSGSHSEETRTSGQCHGCCIISSKSKEASVSVSTSLSAPPAVSACGRNGNWKKYKTRLKKSL